MSQRHLVGIIKNTTRVDRKGLQEVGVTRIWWCICPSFTYYLAQWMDVSISRRCHTTADGTCCLPPDIMATAGMALVHIMDGTQAGN